MALLLGDINRDDLGVQWRVEISLDHTKIFLGLREDLLHGDHARNIPHCFVGGMQAPIVLDVLLAHRLHDMGFSRIIGSHGEAPIPQHVVEFLEVLDGRFRGQLQVTAIVLPNIVLKRE